MSGSSSRHVVAGDDLVGFLERGAAGGSHVEVAPPPRSWAAIKPGVLRALRERESRGLPLPRFLGYPLCAVGVNERGFPVIPSGEGPAHPACDRCGARPGCSPPAAWSDELAPFSPRDELLLWRRWHRRLASVAGLAERPELDRLVETALAGFVGPLAAAPRTVEPSVTLGPSGIEPVVRAAIFHGYEPRDDGAGRLATEVHLETFAALHEVAGQPPPRGLLGLLARFAPFPFPMGFEAPAAAPPSLKAYLVVERMAPERKRAALAALLAHARAAPPPLLAEVPEADVDMIGLGTADGRLATVKLYVRRDPTRPFARASLPALAPSHPAVALAEGRAYATIDLVQPRPR